MKKNIFTIAATVVVMGMATVANAQVDNKIMISDHDAVSNAMSVAFKPGCNHGVPYTDDAGNFTGGVVENHAGLYAFVGGGVAMDNGKSEVHGNTSSTRGLAEAGIGYSYHREGWLIEPFGEIYAGGLIGSDFSAMAGARAGVMFFPCSKFRIGPAFDFRYQNQKDRVDQMDFQSNKIAMGFRLYIDFLASQITSTKWAGSYPIKEKRPFRVRAYAGIMLDKIEQPHNEAVGPQLRKWDNTRLEFGLQLYFGSL